MDYTKIYEELRNAVHDQLEEHGVKLIEFNKEYKNWTGDYPLEDSLLRMAKVIAELSNN
jgi:hypothetical protein